jgi:hypothetical protein
LVNILSHRSGRRLGIFRLALVWLIGCLCIGGWLLVQGVSPSGGSPGTAGQQLSATPVSAAESSPQYRNIEDIRVGQRVMTPGTVAGESLPTAVNPLTWKKLTLRMENRWPDGTMDVTNVQTLQSPQWLAETHAAVGAMVPLPLDLKEMGEPQFSAEVMAIDTCPAIQQGAGRVVLTTVNHLNAFLFDLAVNSERGPPQTIEVTGWHKLYSESQQWTSVCDLKVGEVLRGRNGPLTVQTLTRHPGTQTVYNMTVEDEHQYYVSALDLLAHNVCQSEDRQALNSLIKEATNNGTTPLSVEDANTVLDWADEQGISGVRAGPGDVGTPSNWTANPNQPHIHIPGTGLGGHIPVEPGVIPR